ncbi:MAG: tRNA lysidine(34) synthetase TilS [Deltaproteobacteria bacterium]|nr:tRNA lysidine(34) synthetase TilS [Deltaproteobacteria bacterium]
MESKRVQRVDLQKRVLERYLRLPRELREVPVFVAVSGGLDSSVLAAVALSLRERLPALRFLHVNYRLRIPDSDREEAALRAWAGREGVAIDALRLRPQPKRANLQAWARELRLAFFQKVMLRRGGGLLWMAHHRQDQAETVLVRLLRGAGLKGLGGMESLETLGGLWVFRPFLEVPRSALEVYAKSHSLEFHHDRSNDGDFYLRNRIRHRILPLLLEENPRACEVLEKVARRAGEAADALEVLAKAWLKKRAKGGRGVPQEIERKALCRHPVALRAAILEVWLAARTEGPLALGVLLEEVLETLESPLKTREFPLKGGKNLVLSSQKIQIRPRSRKARY